MSERERPSPRLYVLQAREAPRAVVFRRGPSSEVAVIGWDTERHAFALGQWFRGRVYERRCDLSPSGERLVYFAASHRGPIGTWTAVSRPPFLRALAMWPKDDTWGGGGLFVDERTLQLNHRLHEHTMVEGEHVPADVGVVPFGERPGGGEDEPLLSARLRRDGWEVRDPGETRRNPADAAMGWTIDPPQVWARGHGPWELRMELHGIGQRKGSWYAIGHRVVDRGGGEVLDLGRSDWADWSRSGELLVARAGRLHRGRAPEFALEELIDLHDLRFTEVAPPAEALGWRGPPPEGRPLA